MKSGDQDQAQAAQRIKVGMIGLGIVVLLIALATAIFNSANKEPAVTVVGSPKADVVANLAISNDTFVQGGGPLTELGVAPGADNAAAPVAPTGDGPRR